MPADKPLDMIVCELQHRIDELLRDNDSLMQQNHALTHAVMAMAEKIEELEDYENCINRDRK